MYEATEALLEKINDLHKQATHERSHFYVASVLVECDKQIRDLRDMVLSRDRRIAVLLREEPR